MARLWLSIKIGAAAGVIALCLAASSYADENRAWTGDFMRMGAGARAMGMGNAYTAVEGDIYSSYFNPAGLTGMRGRQFTFSYRYLTMDRVFRYFAFGSPTGPDAGFAVSWLNAGTDDIVGRDLNGKPIGILDDTRNAFTLSFAKELSQYVSIGLNTKYVIWKLASEDATAFGFDLGVMVHPYKNLAASLTVRDIRSRFIWQSGRWEQFISDADGQKMEKVDRFPKYYTAGISYKFLDEKLLVAATAESIENYPISINTGISYKFNPYFAFRTGFYNYNSDDSLDYGSFTGGFSINVTRSIGFDYAYMTDGIDDGAIHIMSLVIGYGDVRQ